MNKEEIKNRNCNSCKYLTVDYISFENPQCVCTKELGIIEPHFKSCDKYDENILYKENVILQTQLTEANEKLARTNAELVSRKSKYFRTKGELELQEKLEKIEEYLEDVNELSKYTDWVAIKDDILEIIKGSDR